MVEHVSVDLQCTGENIVRLRKQRGLSVKDLQEIFGFSTPQAIYKWQQGITLPTIDNLVILANVFQVSLDDIVVVRVKGEKTDTNVNKMEEKIA